MNRPADWQARSEAIDPGRSFIVQAPAGSGKTELLAQRMMVLLAGVDNPEEVIAITFTRKAAAEMANRIVGHLREADAGGDESRLEPHRQLSRRLAIRVLDNDRRLGWNLLEQPSRLRIRTIDSLCGELARQLPILSGTGGELQATEKAEPLYREAAMRTMASIERSGDPLQADIRRILDRYDNRYDRLVELLTSMLASRDQWLGFLLDSRRGEGFDRHALEEALESLVHEELRKALELTPGFLLDELPRILVFALEHEPDDRHEITALLEPPAPDGSLALSDDPEFLPGWIALANRLLNQKGQWYAGPLGKHGFPPLKSARNAAEEERFRAFKDDGKTILGRLQEYEAFRQQLQIVRGLPSPTYPDRAWSALESLGRILLRAAQEWEFVMRESGLADFTEIAAGAIRSLGSESRPTDLAMRLDYRIRHLLVDEFQDTSHGQIRLLKGLTAGWSEGDGHSLFLVGDPMQSIYRFRKAEVSLFIRAYEGSLFEHLRLEPLQLRVNFRSSAPIVDWVNHHFSSVLPTDNDTVSGAVRYSASSPGPNAATGGQVKIRVYGQEDERREAEQIAEIIGNASPDDHLAILVRARKHAFPILALLDRLKRDDERFRYRAVRFTPLADTALVSDLVSLTLALCQPADRLSWLAVLRAPFVGLGLADLDALAGGKNAALVQDALAAFLNGEGPGLSADGRDRLLRTGPVLLEAARLHGRKTVRSRVENGWMRLGGPACLGNESELADAATFFDLLSDLEDNRVPIDRDSLDRELKDLHAEPDAGANTGPVIDVMTVYEAKGLEFDTVILPGLNRRTRGDETALLHWFERAEEDQVVMCPMRDQVEKDAREQGGDLVTYISAIEKRRQALENGRLLYVAATRAKKNLHLFATVRPDRNDRVKARDGTLLAELWPTIAEEQTPLVLADAFGEPGEAAGEASLGLPQVMRRLEPGWSLPEPPTALNQGPLSSSEPREYIEYQWAGEDARLTGELVHRLLQHIAEHGESAWRERSGMKGFESWCRQRLLEEGAMGHRADAVIERVNLAVENALASKKGQWILGARNEAACEMAVTAVLEDQAVKLVLDRTFVSDGDRWIIDYKTSSHEGGGLKAFLESEAERYRPQLERYRRALALTEPRPIRMALYFPLLDRFLEL